MNIAMMADTYKPHISGVTNHIALTKRTLDARGHKTFVFTLGGEDYIDEELYIVRSPAIPLAETGFSFSFRYTRSAQRKLDTMNVAHVHHPFISGRLALRYCQDRGIPIIYTNHTRLDLYAQAYLPQVPEALSETFLQTYMPRFCRHCDLVVAPSPGLAQVLRRLGVDTAIEIIPNGVDLSRFQNVTPTISRGDLGLDDDDRVLIYVGRVGPEKNLTTLLRAFAGAKNAVERLHLIIVGGGPEVDNLRDWSLRAGIAGRVRFVGPVDYETVPSYLTIADAFATASMTEVHPLSLVEAMAGGLPALGIKSPGIEDTIEDGLNGFLSRDDLADFTARMVRLMLDDELRRKFAACAKDSARRYDVEHTSDLLLKHYERLAANRGTRRGVPSVVKRIQSLFR